MLFASRIRPAWWGILTIGLLTLLIASTASSYQLFLFNSVLLASMGAIALTILQGTAGLISVGNAGFMLVGAFGAVFMQRQGLPFPANIVGAVLLAGVAGLIVGMPALRLRGLYLVLSTLAAHFIAVFVGNLYQSSVPEAAFSGFSVPILFGSFGERSGALWAIILFISLSVIILGASRVNRERYGRALKMIRDHEHVAPTLGISVPRYKLQVFVLSSMVIGFQGALLAHLNGNVQVETFPLHLGFQYILIVVIGGLGSIPGAVIGTSVVVALPVLVPEIIKRMGLGADSPLLGANISLVAYGIIVIYFVTASPDGIIGLLRSARTRLRVGRIKQAIS